MSFYAATMCWTLTSLLNLFFWGGGVRGGGPDDADDTLSTLSKHSGNSPEHYSKTVPPVSWLDPLDISK